MIKRWIVICIPIISLHCAVLHHAQLADIDNRQVGKPIEIKVSEMGFDRDQAVAIGKRFSNQKTSKQLDQLNAIISLFQMGPKTGLPVFDDTYAENILGMLIEQCPSGQITDILSIRETRAYPVISGEIVKLTAKCIGPL